MPTFAEARRQHDGGANAVVVSLFQNVAHAIRCDRDDYAVDLLGKISYRSITFVAENFIIARIDGEYSTLKSAIPKVADYFRSAPGALRRPDDCNGFGIE